MHSQTTQLFKTHWPCAVQLYMVLSRQLGTRGGQIMTFVIFRSGKSEAKDLCRDGRVSDLQFWIGWLFETIFPGRACFFPSEFPVFLNVMNSYISESPVVPNAALLSRTNDVFNSHIYIFMSVVLVKWLKCFKSFLSMFVRHYRKRSASRGRSGSRSKSRSPDKRSKKDDGAASRNRDRDRNRRGERSRSRDRRRSRSRDRKRPRWVVCEKDRDQEWVIDQSHQSKGVSLNVKYMPGLILLLNLSDVIQTL